jgi:hypothetical protein
MAEPEILHKPETARTLEEHAVRAHGEQPQLCHRICFRVLLCCYGDVLDWELLKCMRESFKPPPSAQNDKKIISGYHLHVLVAFAAEEGSFARMQYANSY